MILTIPGSLIQAILGSAPSPAWPFSVDFVDVWRTPSQTVNGGVTGALATTTSTLVPAIVQQQISRTVTSLSITNASAVSTSLLIAYNVSGTLVPIYTAVLNAGDLLTYSDANGFQVLTAGGAVKVSTTLDAIVTGVGIPLVQPGTTQPLTLTTEGQLRVVDEGAIGPVEFFAPEDHELWPGTITFDPGDVFP